MHIADNGDNLCGRQGKAATLGGIPPGRYCFECATIAVALIELAQGAQV